MGKRSRSRSVAEPPDRIRAAGASVRAPAGTGSDSWPGRTGDLAALLVALPLVIPFLRPGWFFGHDNMHLIRLFEQDVMIRAGQFPVRWYPDVAGGYGSSHPQYYAPIFYLAAQAFALAGVPIAAALKATVALVVLGTSVAMYRLARRSFGDGPGIVAAAAYSYAPYHMLDLYVRTAFSELTVFLFLPLTLLAFNEVAKRPTSRTIAAAAAALGGLCLAHTITVMLIPPLLGAYLGILWVRGVDRKALASIGAAAGVGAMLAAFFLLPLVLEKDAVVTEIYAAGYFDYHQHFVAARQLITSPWGFGLSRPGTDDGISFRLGLLQILGCGIVAISWKRIMGAPRETRDLTLYAAGVAAAGIFMALDISSAIWSIVPPLRYVQFPWRFLLLPAFGMSILCGAAAWSLSPAAIGGREKATPVSRRGWSLTAALVAAAVFAVAGAGMFGFKKRIPIERIGYGGDHTDMRERDPGEAERSPTVFTRDFIRRQTLHWFDHLPPGGYPYPPQDDLERPRMEIASGRAAITRLEEGPARFRCHVNASEPSILRLNVYRFPGWVWRVDGAAAEAAVLPGRRPVMAVKLPAGEHDVEALFVRTPSRWAGDLISLAALAGVVALSVAGIRSRPTSG